MSHLPGMNPSHLSIDRLDEPYQNLPQLYTISVDKNYLETLKIKLNQGGNFTETESSQSTMKLIFNKKAVDYLGIDNPLGRKYFIPHFDCTGEVVGIIDDFHYVSLHNAVEPLMLVKRPEFYTYFAVHIDGSHEADALAHIRSTYEKYTTEFDFYHATLDDRLKDLYKSEFQSAQVLSSFSIFAIFIACMGLFGLAAFTAETHTREIGVRKVVGASVSNIIFMLSSRFLKWVLIANIFAWPVVYLVMRHWLNSFAYSEKLNLVPFILSGLLTTFIALATVFIQANRAALINPVNALRVE